MEAKKHPVLLVTLGAFGLVALTGVVLAGLEYSNFSKNSSALAASERKVNALLTGEPVALTKENVDAAQKNLDDLKAAETKLREDLLGAANNRFESEFKGDPGELGSIIKESVERWRGVCRDADIKIVAAKPSEFAFGFSRYFQTGVNPQKSLKEIHRQTRIVDFLLKTLVEAKLKSQVRLVSVEREPIELPAATRANYNKDEVAGLSDSVFRREGLLRNEFYRIRFVGRTDVLRRLVNAVTDSGRALSVRGVEVSPASSELLVNRNDEPGAAPVAGGATLPDNFFGTDTPTTDAGAAPAANSAPKTEVVVADAPSDIVVTLEFIEPVKPDTAAPAVETPAAN